jgi:hypothetical protein
MAKLVISKLILVKTNTNEIVMAKFTMAKL